MLNDSISLVKHQIATTWLGSPDLLDILTEILEAFEGVPVEPFRVIYPYERVTPPETFPAAELLGLDSTPQGASSAQQYHHHIDVLVTVAGGVEDVIVKQVEALILAIRKLSYRKTLPMAGGVAAPVIPGVENYGPLIRRRGAAAQPLVKGATIRLTIPTFGE